MCYIFLMSLHFNSYDHIGTFFNDAIPFLYKSEAENSLIIGVAEMLQAKNQYQPDMQLITIKRHNSIVFAALYNPKRSMVITEASDEVIEFVAKQFKNRQFLPPGIIGPKKTVTKLKAHLEIMFQKNYITGMDQKLYKLTQVQTPQVDKTELRHAGDSDLEIAAQWLMNFSQEATPLEKNEIEHLKEMTRNKIKNNQVFLLLKDKLPVAMAHITRPTQNGASISAVYTPPDFRKKGYGSLVTALLSQKILDDGKDFCVLYTDTKNSTSNSIYKKIGYREISDSLHVLLKEDH